MMQRLTTAVSKMKAPANEMNTHWLELYFVLSRKRFTQKSQVTSHKSKKWLCIFIEYAFNIEKKWRGKSSERPTPLYYNY